MKSLWLFLGGLFSGLLLMGLSYEYHFVMSEEGFLIVPKSQSSLSKVYVDIRDWSITDWGDHPEVARALIADGRSDLVKASVADETLKKLLPSLGSEPEVANPFEVNSF
ncbi:MAG: hypothetical protein P8M30_07330 [Planctomycetaceae bacterium]|nr:hypothetical protein [Planctomycetaceae bacterium]